MTEFEFELIALLFVAATAVTASALRILDAYVLHRKIRIDKSKLRKSKENLRKLRSETHEYIEELRNND